MDRGARLRRRSKAASMCHQDRHIGVVDDALRVAAKQHFGFMAVTVSPSHKQTGPNALGRRQELGRGILAVKLNNLGRDAAQCVVGRQIFGARSVGLQFSTGEDADALGCVHDVQR